MTTRRVLIGLLVLYVLNTAYVSISVATNNMPSVIFFALSTFLPFLFAILHASKRLGWKQMLLMLGLTFVVSLLLESVGVATGLVYGPYHYTDQLGPKFLGLVPLYVPLGWFLMSYPSFVIADWIVPVNWSRVKRGIVVAAFGALIMTAWDLVMDPARVFVGQWVWDVDGAYFGVPLQNYWGWWLTTFIALALFLFLSRYSPPKSRSASFDRLALISYILIVTAEISGALIINLRGPALAGFFATIPWIFWGWLAMGKASSTEKG